MTELSSNLTCVHNTEIGTSRCGALAGAALRQNGGYMRGAQAGRQQCVVNPQAVSLVCGGQSLS
jgi:hypothetical protein